MQWTTEQEKVIEHKEGNLLVAAAAGSGKTAVLVQHVIERIMDPSDPVKLSEMVIMTFTEAAAQEMRDRIKTALEEKLREHPDNADLVREAGSIQNAGISTIDAFCKRFITENYAAIDLDPGFRLGDQGELKLLQGDILEELLEEAYAEGDADFLCFADTFARGKTDESAALLVQKLYEDAAAHPWPEEYLDECLQERDADGKQLLFRQLQARVRDERERMEYALSVCQEPDGPESYIPNLTSETEALRRAEKSEDLEQLLAAVQAVRFDRMKPTKSPRKDRVAGIRNAVKKDIKEMGGACPAPEPALAEQMEAGIRSSIRGLVELTKKFIQRYQEEKESRHMLDFADLEHKALEILYTVDEEGNRQPSRIADDCARQYREILVDEYQDSNFVQEALIYALSAERFGRPDVFQVGDVKQSIYSFRQARPELFLTKYHDASYPRIELSKNFRSRNEVIRAVNRVFRRVMRASLGGIDYDERAALHYGYPKAEEREEIDPKYQCELLLLAASKDRAEELLGQAMAKEEAEAHLIASRIRKLHAEGVPYRDIVILLRSPGGWADTLVETLGADGIPAYCTSNEGYFDTVEVETVLSLLHVIDNPRQDIALAAVLHSPIFDFSDEELAQLTIACGSLQAAVLSAEAAAQGNASDVTRVAEAVSGTQPEISAETEETAPPSDFRSAALAPALQEKLQKFCAALQRYRSMARYLPIHELLYRIFDETGYYHYASAMPAGKRRKANLDAMIDMSLSFEKTSYKGLFDYIRYIEKLRKYNSDQGEAAVYSDQDDLVRIMSIHKSKGLQFPVVFLSGMGRRFNKTSLNAAVLVDAELGIGCDYVDLERKLKVPSVKRAAIRRKQEADQLGEELRVLYVAMTRAEEKLIMTAAVEDTEKLLSKYPDAEVPLSGTQLMSAGCFLDWILMAEGAENLMHTGAHRSVIGLTEYTLEDLALSEEQHIVEKQALRERLAAAVEAVDTGTPEYRALQETLSYRYPHAEATRMYPKHAVSELKEAEIAAFEVQRSAGPGALEAEGNASAGRGEADTPHSDASGPHYWQLAADHSDTDSVQPRPKQYLEKAGADVGDAYHHAFECYDYGDTSEDFMTQLRQKLPEAEVSLINPRRFRAFLESPLAARFRRAQEAGQLYREQHFMKQVPHHYLFPDSTSTEPVILQGIIDAFLIEDDGIVLVDYKSDHVRSADMLIGRYRKQLELYADALEQITGLPVKEKLIYSIILERSIAL